ncbi:hypothetical protein HPB51_027688 [Rhipicephalus microplus]|uniref:Uncharacterized protein n=1 Tax=Rhipicephalus microplus TaxID=6941 RepID=A0A9J6CZN5_RHIMP|nr:hypothetical protein HPB51_027688 [Rhipicephalus microplus]
MEMQSARSPLTANWDTEAHLAEMHLHTHACPGLRKMATAGPASPPPRCDDTKTTALGPHRRVADSRGSHRRDYQSHPPDKQQSASSDESEGGKSAKNLLRTHRKKNPSLAKSFKGLVRTAAAVPPKRRNDAAPTFYDRERLPRPPRLEHTGQPPVLPADRQQHPRDFLPTVPQLPVRTMPYQNEPADVNAVMPQTFPANPTPVPNVPPAHAPVFQRGGTPMRAASHPVVAVQKLYHGRETSSRHPLPLPRTTVVSPTRSVGEVRPSVSRASDVNWRPATSGSRTSGSGTSSPISTLPSWKKELCAAGLALCLAFAAVLSFWAFNAITDVVIAGRDFSDDNAEPITVQLQDDSAIGVTSRHGAFQYGPERKNEASQFGRRSSMDIPGGLPVKNATADGDPKYAL